MKIRFSGDTKMPDISNATEVMSCALEKSKWYFLNLYTCIFITCVKCYVKVFISIEHLHVLLFYSHTFQCFVLMLFSFRWQTHKIYRTILKWKERETLFSKQFPNKNLEMVACICSRYFGLARQQTVTTALLLTTFAVSSIWLVVKRKLNFLKLSFNNRLLEPLL